MGAGRSLFVVTLGLWGMQACGQAGTGAGAREVTRRTPVAAGAPVTPARLVALPDSSASLVDQDPDGSLRFISRGMRVTAHPDGSVERGRQLFPPTRTMRTLRLPERLGGGFVFFSSGSGSTHLWRAPTWTGDLAPLANLDFDAAQVVDGFDRIYVQDQRSHDLIALDPETGNVVDLGPLPASPSYASMAFADAWFGAVEVPFRGVMVTFDAGASWRPLELAQTYGVSLELGEIVINASTGRWVLGADGSLRQRSIGSNDDLAFLGAGRRPSAVPAPSASLAPPEPAPPPPVGPLGKLPLRVALLYGMPDSESTAVVAKDGALARLGLSDGRVIDIAERAFASGGTCTGITLGSGIGFVCGQERGATTVYALEAPLGLRQVLRFEDPRYVASSGNGALVVRGPCSGRAADAIGAYCVRSKAGRTTEMRVRGDLGVERITALSDGRTAVLVPPRLGAPGTLTLVESNGKAKTVRLRLPKEDGPTLALLRKGLWLDGFVERETRPDDRAEPAQKQKKLPNPLSPRKKGKHADAVPGKGEKAKSAKTKQTKTKQAKTKQAKTKQAKTKQTKGKKQLAGWVVAAGPFVGVRVDLDGTVHVGRIESDIDRSMISGQLALVLGRGGAATESTDGGFSWNDVSLPPEVGGTVARARSPEAERGCSKVGCIVGSWMRVGWGKADDDEDDVETIDAPSHSKQLPSGGGRWKMTCTPTGKVAGALPKPQRGDADDMEEVGIIGSFGSPSFGARFGRMPATTGADEIKSTEWLPFKGARAPNKKKTDVGFDFGTEHMPNQIRGYAWGARGASWDRVGNFLIRAYDEFSLDSAVWSTAASRSPWGDPASVAAVFGQDMNSPSAWHPVMEPSGRAAAILLNTRGTSELLLAEEGRGVTFVPDAAKWGLYQLSGAVKVGSTWFLGSYISGSSFRLFKVDGGRVTLLRDYPISGGWRPNTTLVANVVRNVRSDALGIWVESRRTRGSSTRWFVYAVSPDDGDILDLIELTPKDLAKLPPACEDGAEGWLLVGEPPVEPYVDYVASADGVRSRQLEAAMVADTAGVCVEKMSAEADTPVPRLVRGDVASIARGVEPIPLVLEERGRVGRRWSFHCVP